MKHDPLPATSAAAGDAADPLADYTPVPCARHDGWTAERQRIFLSTLADTGSISAACQAAKITARSAYRLRRHPDGKPFADGWDHALLVATGTLVTLAFERASRGRIREYWKNGVLVGETREPSDGMLKWLLAHLAREEFGSPDKVYFGSRPEASRRAFPQLLDKLTDTAVPADPLSAADFRAAAPEHTHDPVAVPADPDEDEEEWDETWDEDFDAGDAD